MKNEPAERAVDLKQSTERLKDPPFLYRLALYLVFAETAMPLVAIGGFVFDQEISAILQGPGFQSTNVTRVFLIEQQYTFFLNNGLGANLHIVDFLIFEIIAWLVVLVVLARLSTALLLVEYFDARLEFRALGISFFKLLFSWTLIGPLAIYVSLHASFGYSSVFIRSLMTFSPRAFLCIQAFVLCLGSLFFCEGLCWMLQLTVAIRRRGRGL